jgi:hypothetical protein
MDTLKKSATLNSPSKISFTSSVTNHYYNLNRDDLLLVKTKELFYNYAYTKIMVCNIKEIYPYNIIIFFL